MVLIQKWPFFQTFFLGNIGHENVFYDSLHQKNSFLGYRKIGIFPKGLTHGFGPKMAIIPSFFFVEYRPGKVFLRYCTTKKRRSRL